MFAFLIFILALQQVHSACNVQELCPENNAAIQTEIVDAHNAFRREVQPTAANMLKVSYREDIGASAQSWVDHCIQAHGPPSARVLDGYGLGENLFYSSSPSSWTDVISAWDSEKKHYVYADGSTNHDTVRHYTQVVWNSSYRVGCGMTLCNGTYIYGCRYYRAGNFRGWLPYKLGPSCASCPDNCEDKLCTNPCPHVNKYSNCPILKILFRCSDSRVAAACPATCQCTNQIIPIG